jgi:hypothetical protein
MTGLLTHESYGRLDSGSNELREPSKFHGKSNGRGGLCLNRNEDTTMRRAKFLVFSGLRQSVPGSADETEFRTEPTERTETKVLRPFFELAILTSPAILNVTFQNEQASPELNNLIASQPGIAAASRVSDDY